MSLLQDARTAPDVDWAPPSDTVWHYTDAHALLSICQTGRLWASHAAGLNDSSEVAYGWGVMREAFEGLKGDLSSEAPQDLLDIMDNAVHVDARSVGYHYVLSASADGEVLNQWQHYGHDGYALALPADQPLAVTVEETWTESTELLSGTWRAVLYDRDQQLLQAARSLLGFMLEEGTFRHTDEMDLARKGRPALRWSALEFLSSEVGFYKHPAFSAEHECRMVFSYDQVLVQPSTRVRNGQFLQYLDVGMPRKGVVRHGLGDALPSVLLADHLPVQEIRCGPTPEPLREARLASMRRMLASTGHPIYDPRRKDWYSVAGEDGVKVSASDLPYVP